MTKAESILEYIKWNKSYDIVYIDADRALSMMYRMKKYDQNEMMCAWRVIAQKAPFIAYALLQRHADIGNVCDSADILEIIWKTVNQKNIYNKRDLADILSLASLLQKEISPEIVKHISESEDTEALCILAFKNLELIYDKEKNILSLLKVLYRYVELIYVENSFGNCRYQFSKYMVEPLVVEFISELVHNGAFILAYLVKKTYAVEFEDVNVTPEEVYSSLCKCNNYNYFRGGVIYKEFLRVDNDIKKLKKWYIDLTNIKTKIAIREQPGFKLLYLCQALQINPNTPEDVLREVQINISNMPFVEMNRKQYIREYRKAVYALIKVNNIGWCKKFIEGTYDYNIDRYENSNEGRWPLPRDVIKHIGSCDKNELILYLLDSRSNIEDIVYIYMNSFLRGLVCYPDFINSMYTRYGSNLIKEMQKYHFGGSVTLDQIRNIYYLNTNTVRKGKAKFFLTQESTRVLSKLGIEENGSWFSTRLMSYNPNSSVYKFAVLGYGEQRLDELIKRLQEFERNGEVTKKFVDAISSTNISLVEVKSDQFIELCICILAAIVSCCNDRKKMHETIKGVERVNYYAYNPKRNSGKERNLQGIKPAQFRDIRKYWEKLFELNLNVFDCFEIYRNTVLRRMYGLSEFLEKFVDNTECSYSDFFSHAGDFAGHVQTFANSEQVDDCMALFVAPAEFKLTNKIRENTERKYDRYLLEIPLYGESATSVRKENSICKHMPVRFEIEKYDGNGLFIIKNLRLISK